jgi:hypothetical protein
LFLLLPDKRKLAAAIARGSETKKELQTSRLKKTALAIAAVNLFIPQDKKIKAKSAAAATWI